MPQKKETKRTAPPSVRAQELKGLITELVKRKVDPTTVASALDVSFFTASRWFKGTNLPQRASLKRLREYVAGLKSPV